MLQCHRRSGLRGYHQQWGAGRTRTPVLVLLPVIGVPQLLRLTATCRLLPTYATAVAYNGYVYQIGGYAGSATAVVDYAAITSSGALAAPGSCAGTITGYWCASTSTSNGSLPAATYLATAVAYNGYVYQIGGYTTAAHRRSGLRGYQFQHWCCRPPDMPLAACRLLPTSLPLSPTMAMSIR